MGPGHLAPGTSRKTSHFLLNDAMFQRCFGKNIDLDVFDDVWKKTKHRINDASNDVNRPPLDGIDYGSKMHYTPSEDRERCQESLDMVNIRGTLRMFIYVFSSEFAFCWKLISETYQTNRFLKHFKWFRFELFPPLVASLCLPDCLPIEPCKRWISHTLSIVTIGKNVFAKAEEWNW